MLPLSQYCCILFIVRLNKSKIPQAMLPVFPLIYRAPRHFTSEVFLGSCIIVVDPENFSAMHRGFSVKDRIAILVHCKGKAQISAEGMAAEYSGYP